MELRPLSKLFLVLTLAAVSLSAASAQSLNKHAIKSQLLHKTVMLRGQYVCPTPEPCTLTFNQQGKLQGKAAVAPFSLSAVHVNKIKFKRNKLELSAQPATILRLNKTGPPKFRTLLLGSEKSQIQIQIHFDASKPSELQTAVQAVFAGTIQEALKAAPPKKRKLELYSLPLVVPVTRDEAAPELAEVGWPPQQTTERLYGASVAAPKPVHVVQPKYTDKARSHKVQGNCEVYIVVNAQGFPQNIRVIKSLPDGLDEQTILAISQFRFKPAMENGNPVPVRLALSESYRLH